MSNHSSDAISLPKGGGALQGLGEKFTPDLFTGTGNFALPIALPTGRNGFQPQLSLAYSTGNGNGPFGLGWSLSIPGVSRKTSHGIPRYDDLQDTFIFSGAEDLILIQEDAGPPPSRRYRPRTEGLFAKIVRYLDAQNDYWEVRGKDGQVSQYGTPGAAGQDTAVVADPDHRSKVFAWKLTRTTDSYGNVIEYIYQRDAVQTEDTHHWDQLYLAEIHYADYGDTAHPQFLIKVKFTYQDRPDHFSDYHAGFEVRTTQRCTRIDIYTNAAAEILTRTYHLDYADQSSADATTLPLNGVSLLTQVRVEGRDGAAAQWLPPLKLRYTSFQPETRKFSAVAGSELPPLALNNPSYDLADLFGRGLPDILEMNGVVRYWRNLGSGRFDLPREMRDAPAGVGLADPGVQLLDANGDGRLDLMITTETLAGYYPLRFGGLWDSRSFQRYRNAPSFSLKDPEVRMVDLDGDGITDAIRSGTRFECFFNDAHDGWAEMRAVERRSLDIFPNVNFSDPRVKWANMTGGGLQDVVLVHDGCVEYWPALGRGEWARPVIMRHSPRFPDGYDPKRILLGDVDGDGAADLIYVDDGRVTLWINQCGNGWSDPIRIEGTPPVTDLDAVRLVDLLGNGIGGLLWSADADTFARAHMFFLDFTGGVKPYLLTEVDNQAGAITRIAYCSSTQFYLEDQKQPATRWQTPLPFPVQVVAQVEVLDLLSGGKLTTEYSYHHGYWDGAEREFRGFGRVDQRDTEAFVDYAVSGLHPDQPFQAVEPIYFSPPTETRTWFHQGPLGDEFGDWSEADYSAEFWAGDPQSLPRPQAVTDLLNDLPRRVKRDALRTLRSRILRSELYGLDGTALQNRPYTVIEQVYGVREEFSSEITTGVPIPSQDATHIFFPYTIAQRTTQWDRGVEPMSRFAFTGDYDACGQARSQISIAVPRGRDFRVAATSPVEPYLATLTLTDYAQRDDAQVFIADRVARTTGYEIVNDGRPALLDLKTAIENGSATRRVINQTVNFYDGDAFKGLSFGQIGGAGALVRTETLMMTEDIVQQAYKSGDTVLNPPEIPPCLKPISAANRINVALAVNGGTASASSIYDQDYPPSAAINGDRKGGTWPIGWVDNTYNAYPDWLQIDFSGTKTINEIDVFTTQDAPLDGTGPAVDPTLDLTFKKYGLVAFDVQYWTGTAWSTIPNGSVTGNDKVWRQFKSLNIATSRIRVVCNNALLGYSRIVEVEAHESGTGANVALAANGGKATASSVIQPWPPRMTIDGDRIVYHWVGQVPFQFPGWLQVNFNEAKTIDEIDLFLHQDVSKPMTPPTEDMTTPYAITDFEIQCWDGAQWVTVPGGNVTGNNKVWRKFRFPYVKTDRIRLLIHNSSDGNVRVQELEAYALDPIWLSEDYPPEFQSLLPMSQPTDTTRPGLSMTPAGFGFAEGDATFARGYFAATTRQRYDFQENSSGKGRGLVKATRDALGHDTRITFDTYDLLAVQVVNPAGLTTTATYDYRVLQPKLATEPNGNRTTFTFSPLGLVTSVAAMGKTGENVGDTPAAPGKQLVYDLNAFAERQQPISVRSIQRVHHINEIEVPQPERDATIEKIEYSDGFGRPLQTRTQAEDVLFGDPLFGGVGLPVDQTDYLGLPKDVVGRKRSAGEPPNVVVSGWQIYDNKGHVVEKYEPFFSTSWDYGEPTDAQRGQKACTFYDSRGRVVRTLNPDGSEQRVVHGIPFNQTNPDSFAPTPWEAYTYDANDNAGRTHPATSASYQNHWNTPASTIVDALGRALQTVVRNGNIGMTDRYTTRWMYDIHGNVLTITDALDRVAFWHVYDLGNRPLRLESIDAGLRRTVLDAAGNVVEQRDSKGALVLHAYDVLNRPIRLWARDGTNQPLTLREHRSYGDSADSGLTAAQAAASNLLGKLYLHYDEAGLTTSSLYDFKGKLLEKARQVIGDDALLSVFDPPPADWSSQAFRVNWEPPSGMTLAAYADTLLDPTVYQTRTAYDALNRIKAVQYPQSVDGMRAALSPLYNSAGGLESVSLDNAPYVNYIAYNAKGQRTLIVYGNGIMTRSAYDARTFRLARMRTEGYTQPDPLTYHPTGEVLQDFAYEYDLAGNLIRIHDRTPQSGVPNTPLGADALDRILSYDPIYRLCSATGREFDVAPPPPPWDDQPRGGDPTKAQAYTEEYQYDSAGNMLQLRHRADSGGFTRQFILDAVSNRVVAWTLGSDTYKYIYDSNGNLVQEDVARHYAWDYADRLRAYCTCTDGAEPSVHAQYLYDSGGARVKKLVRKQGGQFEVAVYVDGILEHHRLVQGRSIQENNFLHIMDNQKRIALVRVGDPFPDDVFPAVRYQLGDHLDSSNLVLDEKGAWIDREEYTPYGETSFGSFAKKRYRFTGKERDEESSLYYYGARYYAPWLARWVSCDPAGPQEGLGLYTYAHQSPLTFIDQHGEAPGAPPTEQQVTESFRAILTKYNWSFEEQVEATINGVPGRADIVCHPPGMPNRLFWVELKRDDPSLSPYAKYNANQPQYVPLLKLGKPILITRDRSNVSLKGGTSVRMEYWEPHSGNLIEYENLIKEATPGYTQAVKQAVPPFVRSPGGATRPVTFTDRLRTGFTSGGGLLIAGFLINLATSSSAKAATREEMNALQQIEPQVTDRLFADPDRGVLLVSLFRVGTLPESYTYTRFMSVQVITGFKSEAEARKSYEATPGLSENITWHSNQIEKLYRWIPSLNSRTVAAPEMR